MKHLLLIVVLILFSNTVSALNICVAPIEKTDKGISLWGAEGSRDSLSVHIQNREIQLGMSISDCYEYPSNKNVAVVIKNQGKAIESFFINAAEYKNGACIWLNSFYGSWNVWHLEDSKHLCVSNKNTSK